MFGWSLVKTSELEALRDADALLRSTGYHLDVNAEGMIEKSYVQLSHQGCPPGSVKRWRKVGLVYQPGTGPWRRADRPVYRFIDMPEDARG